MQDLVSIMGLDWVMFLMTYLVIITPNSVMIQFWLPCVFLLVRALLNPVARSGTLLHLTCTHTHTWFGQNVSVTLLPHPLHTPFPPSVSLPVLAAKR